MCLLPLLVGAAHAGDERSVVSPDGQLEFRLLTILPEGNGLNTLAYEVRLRGQSLMAASAMGWNIHFQEPFLGENVGLSSARMLHEAGYNGLVADYLQNSSTGRRIQIEVRVWNDGVAFRYTIPQSAILLDLLIEDDATQFRFAQDAVGGRPEHTALPYIEQEAGGAWVGIYQQTVPDFPQMELLRSTPHLMLAHIPDKPHDPRVAYEGKTPWTSPWHIIVTGAGRERLAQSQTLRDLLH